MKAVSWEFALRKLNEWRVKELFVAFGQVDEVELKPQGATTTIFSGETTRILSADSATGNVSLLGSGDVDLFGASFAFWDSYSGAKPPFNESDLHIWEYAEVLEATLLDESILIFACEWPVG